MAEQNNQKARDRTDSQGQLNQMDNMIWWANLGLDYVDKDFAGMMPDIGGVLATAVEGQLTKCVGYTKFKGLLANYLL